MDDEKIVIAVKSREWVMKSYAESGLPALENLELRTLNFSLHPDNIPSGHVALKVLWISVDPYLRSRMTGKLDGLYSPPYELGQVVTAFGVARVMHSKDANFTEGDLVIHPYCPLKEYCIISTNILRKIDKDSPVSPVEYLGALGVPGFAAWVGMLLIGDPKPGENVFVSAAAGAVGMYAGQLAKMRGCRVVGSTGTDEKVKFLKEELKFDDAFNYTKEKDYDVALSKYFPEGIDVYLDNVGGKMLEAVLNHVNRHARIPLCGMISQYNQVWIHREGIRNLLNMVGKEVKMEGYLIGSFLDRFGDFVNEIEAHLKNGNLISKIKVYEGIENFLDSLVSLFTSSNIGKVIVQVNT